VEQSFSARVSPNFPQPSPILETLSLENNGKFDLPLGVEFGILPGNPASLRTLRLKHIPLTNQLLRLTTFTSLDFSHYYVDSCTLLGLLAANKSLESLHISCRNIVGETSCTMVSLPNARDVELSSLTVSLVLEHLCLTLTPGVNIQVLPGGSFYPPDVPSQSLDGLS